MARKHNVKEIGLQIDDVIPFKNEKYGGLVIQWSSNIGFGEYTLVRSAGENDTEWCGDSEHMDTNEDKEFITELMRLFVEKLDVQA